MHVTGSCHCGAIAYEADVVPNSVSVCHCTDCQRLSGSVFRASIASLAGTFVIRHGTPKIYFKIAESGARRRHGFCAECGAPIYATAAEPDPQVFSLRVGGIDQRAAFGVPRRQIWCRSALPWSMDISAVERAERA